MIGEGLPASPGAATGKVVFTPDDAETMANLGEDVILVRKETTPEDIHGMKSAQGGERRGGWVNLEGQAQVSHDQQLRGVKKERHGRRFA